MVAKSAAGSTRCDSDQSVSSGHFTMRERFGICCKLSFKPRTVRSRGAILVLLLNYLVMNSISLVYPYIYTNDNAIVVEGLVGFALILPLAGWLADAYIGRYKVISCSMWIMWMASVLATLSSVLAYLVNGYSDANDKVSSILLVVLVIGLAAYQANIIQFGMDQLNDASTTEMKSFIIWYVCTVIGGGSVGDFPLACLGKWHGMIRLIFVTLNLSLALILLFSCNNRLIKEPVSQNPFKLIYRVIRYAIKNKRPRQRSAFTYCEDELPSRIDFGKSKYGGPFTTEQVEDVKTMFRLIPMVLFGGAMAGGIVIANYLRNRLLDLVSIFGRSSELESDSISNTMFKECYSEASYTHTLYYSGAILLIILHEAVIHPVFQSCTPRIESVHKALLGIAIQITRIITIMVYEVISRHNFINNNFRNTSISPPCFFSNSLTYGSLSNSFYPHWITIPDCLTSISLMMIFIGAVEFLSAQVPYIMKGLMVSITFLSSLLSCMVWYVVLLPFKSPLSIWSTGSIIGCGFWYTLLLAVAQSVCLLILIMLKMRYKKRRREDVLPNEHVFAERYYSS